MMKAWSRDECTTGGYNFPETIMILKITQAGEAVLRQKAKEISNREIKSREIQELIGWMRETMYDAPGVGLAAPQVGISLQLAVIEDKAEYMKSATAQQTDERERRPVPFHVIINPKIQLLSSPDVEFFEGCLSVAGFTAVVSRARKVRVDCLDHAGQAKIIEASGWYARILQHEIDHLAGTLYLDRMQPRTFMSVELHNRHWKDKTMAEVKKLLGEK